MNGLKDILMSNVLPKTLQLHGEEGYRSINEVHPYLFRCSTADGGLFHEFERALVELNDFCFVLQEGLKHYSYQKKLEVDTDPNNFVGRPEEFREAQELSLVLRSEAYDPALVGKLYFPASTLTLLYFQTISFLKDIARVVCGDKFKNKLSSTARALSQQNYGREQPEIVILIELIEESCLTKNLTNECSASSFVKEKIFTLSGDFSSKLKRTKELTPPNAASIRPAIIESTN